MRRLVSGNEACAEAALRAGIRFFGGYPITPSTEIAELMAEELPRVGGVFIQMEDEIASIMAIIGASAAGVPSMTATSGPGFSLMQEGIGYAAMTEVAVVVVNVMRGGPATGLPTKGSQADLQQARWGTHGDHPVVALTPRGVQECFTLTLRAVEISQRLRVPVILLMDEFIGHMREIVSFPEKVEVYHRQKPRVAPSEYIHYAPDNNYNAPYASFGEGYAIHFSGLNHRSDGFPINDAPTIRWNNERLRAKIEDNLAYLEDNYVDDDPDADTLIVAFGSAARSAYEAKLLTDKPIAYIRALTVWPFPDATVRKLAKGRGRVVVPEMNEGQLAREVERCIGADTELVSVTRNDGSMLTPKEVLEALR
ncbi:2-oxoglutarate synthase subunit alpha [candidate division TA06 bacterium B3_TA06]|uniref:2-oxoglutarate synthase subunit alpha n=1 Tax=candidate division TA06 bacterium B3_TA06 TaxID=2012487 RepID=A0A532V6Z4_UNCT6|nr:MAG: 2-oxoglutarate synthase subunit alpha [candidate division TA06 bacterium B3_TA06]